jgi:hypothetical protein
MPATPTKLVRVMNAPVYLLLALALTDAYRLLSGEDSEGYVEAQARLARACLLLALLTPLLVYLCGRLYYSSPKLASLAMSANADPRFLALVLIPFALAALLAALDASISYLDWGSLRARELVSWSALVTAAGVPAVCLLGSRGGGAT